MRINNKCTIILYYIVLYYIILYYIILCYIILYVNIVTKRKCSYEKQVQKISKVGYMAQFLFRGFSKSVTTDVCPQNEANSITY